MLSAGLFLLWLAGLGAPDALAWVTWFDAVAAVLAAITSSVWVRGWRLPGYFGTSLVAAGLLALFVCGLILHGPRWQTGWNLVFACGALALLVRGGQSVRPPERTA